MLYCQQCRKKVDFNSTSVSGPTRAYTLDSGGTIDPTIIHSSSKVINVCKNCGSQSLFQSEADCLASQRRGVQQKASENLALKILGIASIIAGIIFGGILANAAMTCSPDCDAAKMGVFGSFLLGFLIMSVCVGFMGFLGGRMNDMF